MFTKKEKKLLYFYYPIIIAFAVITMILCNVSLINKLYLERLNYLKLISTTVADNINSKFQHYWDKIDFYEQFSLLNNVETEADFKKLVSSKILKSTTNEFVFVLCEDEIITSDGYSGKQNIVNFSEIDITNKETLITEMPAYNNDKYLMFLSPSSLIENKEIYIGCAVKLSYIEDTYITQDFGDESCIYITDNNGDNLYRCNTNLDLNIKGNIYQELVGNSQILHKNKLDIGNPIKNYNPVELKYNGYDKELFIINAGLQSINANLVVCSPAETLSEYSAGIIYTTYLFTPVMAFITIVLILLIMIIYRKLIGKDFLNIGKLCISSQFLATSLFVTEEFNVSSSSFLSFMSHDIRTPLNGIIGMNNIASENIDNPEKMKYCIERIGRSSNSLLNLLNDFLDLSKSERGKDSLRHESVNLIKLIDCSFDMIEGLARAKGHKLVKTYCNLSNSNVLTDELYLRQILINLLGNAVKFTPEGGTINLTLKEHKTLSGRLGINIIIKDNGIGIDKDFLKVIWNPFTQEGDSNKNSHKGSGLGMTLIKRFVDLLDGKISIKSKKQCGTTVKLSFEFDSDLESKCKYTSSSELDLSNYTILLVDDNDINREISTMFLKSLGVNVVEACDGQEAINIYEENEENTFDAILMDIVMPNVNGYDASKAIRSSKKADANRIPIIALTANACEEDIERNTKSGMNEHISKPINLNEFKMKLSNVLSK